MLQVDHGSQDIRPVSTLPQIACCICSVAMRPNPTNMCLQCIKSNINITDGIISSLTIYQCRGCSRWLKPGWVTLERESRELMAMCLRKITGLQKVKLVDATWVWTEEHSRRLKLKLTVQKEIINGAVLQQSFPVDFVIKNQQCVHCHAIYENNTWKAVVQVRQRVEHKRTLFYLEQLILKYNAHQQAINVQSHKDGMDFFFGEKNQAIRMISFLESMIPTQVKMSKKMAGVDNHSNVYTFHYTFMVTILPVCKDDLTVIPVKLAEKLGQFPQLCVVQRISDSIQLVDPFTSQLADVTVENYRKHEFKSLMCSRRLIPFIVLGSEPVLPSHNPAMSSAKKLKKSRLAEVTVIREKDFGVTDQQFVVVTHLGRLLTAGDTVLGYDLTSANVSQDFPPNAPDIVLVRKTYPSEKRIWKLDSLEKDNEVEMNRREREANEADYERFLQQVESDRTMRRNISLYRTSSKRTEETFTESDTVDEEEVRIEEMIDPLLNLRIDDVSDGAQLVDLQESVVKRFHFLELNEYDDL